MNEEIKYKSTLDKPVNQQSKGFEKNFNKTMNQMNVKLNEVDGLLTEKEQSLKKKIFSLPKMEALVFSDPKLSAIYNEMAENGEEKYGYHYNETIQNMIFNDYVLNSPKYLQKYKMAIPKEKKRRDKSGINQLKKAGEKKIAQSGLPKQIKSDVKENSEPLTKVMFLVNDNDSENPDVYAYFPEETHQGIYKTAYSHVGQHSAIHPDYARESRPATPEEYQELKTELEGRGYNLEVINKDSISETTSAGGGSAVAAGIASGSNTSSTGQYSGPSAWGSGDLMKTKGKSNIMRKPIWKGGTIIQESQYLTDPSGFEKYVNELDQQDDVDYIQKHSETYGDLENMNSDNLGIIKTDIQKGKMDDPNLGLDEANFNNPAIKQAIEKAKTEYSHAIKLNNQGLGDKILGRLKSYLESQNYDWKQDPYATELLADYLSEVAKSKAQQRLFGMARAVQKGDLPASKVGGAVKKIAKTVNPDDVEDFASTKHDDLPDKINENLDAKYQSDDIYKYAVNSKYIIGFQGREDILYFKTENDALNYVNQKPSTREYLGIIENSSNKINEHLHSDALISSDVVDIQPRAGEKPFMMQDGKYQFETAIYKDGRKDIVVYSFNNDVYYDYEKWKEIMNINETDQSMIDDNPQTMANKPQPVGNLGGNVPMGTQQTGGMNESKEIDDMTLLEELNNELKAFSIHHQKLVKMNEDRKISAEVNRQRVIDQNPTNFKKDLQHSGTKEIINVEKELQWKDQQTDVKDPQKLGLDIEKTEIKATNATGDEYLKNVGDSANDKGDEIPKRNRTKEEQEEVELYTKGLHSTEFDIKPSQRFEDRMKADMGDKIYAQRQRQLEDGEKQPLYNKESIPTYKGEEMNQFNKYRDVNESMITGRYIDALGKRRLIDFMVSEVKINENVENLFELDFTGLGNTYNSKTVNNKVSVNEGVVKIMESHKFFTDGKNVFAVKKLVKNLNESIDKKQPIVNEQYDKMKHLLGYKPQDFVDTKNVKKNRGF